MNSVTFIIPSINSVTLPRTLQSLVRQTNCHWKAIVVFDGVNALIPIADDRIRYIYLPISVGMNGNAGKVRHHALRFIDTMWIGFVDDDDTLHEQYVEWLYHHAEKDPSIDLFYFRSTNLQGECLPDLARNELKYLFRRDVGMSFAFRTHCLVEYTKRIPSQRFDEWRFIQWCHYSNHKTTILQEQAYHVGF